MTSLALPGPIVDGCDLLCAEGTVTALGAAWWHLVALGGVWQPCQVPPAEWEDPPAL